MAHDVVLVSGSFFPREGGGERQLRGVLAELNRAGKSVAVVTQVLPDRSAPPRFVDGIEVHRVGSAYAFRHLPRVGQVLFVVAATVRTLRLAPRITVSLQMGTASAAAALAARALRKPHVLRLTGGGTARHRSEPVARAADPIGRLWVRLFNRAATLVVAPAQHLLDDFRDSFPRSRARTLYVPNGVTLPDAVPEKCSDVLWYARGGSERSTHQLLEVARRIPELAISTMGRAQVPEAANITALGWQDVPERTIGRHRALLNTSPNEGMPNTVLQALAWGTRVVGYENAGMREIRAAYPRAVSLVAVDDYVALAEHLRRAVREPPIGPQPVTSLQDASRQWMRLLTDT